jgi:nucleotide-binding universal stress UspA family protein
MGALMQQPVMVALDGTEKDVRAVTVAKAIAKLAHTSLHFVRVVGSSHQEEAANERLSAEAELDRVAASAGIRDEHPSTHAVLEASDVAGEVMRQAVASHALVVVLSTRARAGATRAIMGSVADRVVRECPCPVMVVPPEAEFLAGKEMTIKRLLVPLDGSSLAFRCLEFLIQLPHAKELEYALIEVVRPQDSRRAADERLKTTAAWLRSRGARQVETLAVEAPDVASAIVGEVRDLLSDAIAMSTRGLGGIERMVLGSVAGAVVRASELPVLLLTPQVLAAPIRNPA